MIRTLKSYVALLMLVLLAGCATPKSYDYTTFRHHPPRSILVLPPLNESPEVEATYSVLSTMTNPLAESGYYVVPVTLVDETFKRAGARQQAFYTAPIHPNTAPTKTRPDTPYAKARARYAPGPLHIR